MEQGIDPFAHLEPAHEEDRGPVHLLWSARRRRGGSQRNRVMRNEDFLTWKTQRGILVCAALAVRDHCIKLDDKGKPSLLSKPTDRRRPQPPSNDRFVLPVHPLYGCGRGKITRVRFRDQHIGIPTLEPIQQAALVTEIKGIAEEVQVLSQLVMRHL